MLYRIVLLLSLQCSQAQILLGNCLGIISLFFWEGKDKRHKAFSLPPVHHRRSSAGLALPASVVSTAYSLGIGGVSQTPPTSVHAAILVDRQAHCSGYRLHPAIADATLHLSAAAVPPGTEQSLRVPASVGLLLMVPPAAGASFPTASPGLMQADHSVACSYQLMTQKRRSLVIADLVAKEMKAAVSAGATATESIPEFLYQTEWQASQTVLPSAVAANGALKVNLQSARGGFRSALKSVAATSASSVIAVGGRARNTPAMVTRSVQSTSSKVVPIIS